jgi:hypothetical protein
MVLVVAGTCALEIERALWNRRRSAGSIRNVRAAAMQVHVDLMGGVRDVVRGEVAPDFLLTPVYGHSVHAFSLTRRCPVVLIFGSFGCDRFCNDLTHLNKLYKEYKDCADFLFVYITEGPHQMLPLISSPLSESLPAYVSRGLRYFHFDVPVVLDGASREAERAYNAFPRRLVAVDANGRVAVDLGKGLFSDWNLEELEDWLRTARK